MRSLSYLLLALCVVAWAGCSVWVEKDPPAPLTEDPPPPPDTDHEYLWIPGHYQWIETTNYYAWSAGYWEANRSDDHWVEGHYEGRTDQNYHIQVWSPGYWNGGDHGHGKSSR